MAKLETRVVEAAEEALGRQRFVAPLDVLVGIGWIAPTQVAFWRQGRAESLERECAVGAERMAEAVALLRRWAEGRGLVPSQAAYVARTRDRGVLRFTDGGEPEDEIAYRTHWMAPDLPAVQRQRLAEKQSRPPDLVVIWPLHQDWSCAECGRSGGLLCMEGPGALCLRCAELDHLLYLPAGDAALTRRAKAAGGLRAVVVRFHRSRGRYERQGLLVEQAALEQAEAQCLGNEEARARRRAREQARREAWDETFERDLAREVLRLFPGCPEPRAAAIARDAAARGGGSVGPRAADGGLPSEAVAREVGAAVRRQDTRYEALRMAGVPRLDARAEVQPVVEAVLERWRRGSG
jgi:hypothetical protein